MMNYIDLYLDDISSSLACSFVYAHQENIDINIYWNNLFSSKVIKEIDRGNCRYLGGLSGIDIFNEAMRRDNTNTYQPFIDRNDYYWVGYIIAMYQHYKKISFEQIGKKINADRLLSLYKTLHEADVTKVYSVIDDMIDIPIKKNKLKAIRTTSGLSQSQLAALSKVGKRNIQSYEQNKNDINKAQVNILKSLAAALGCDIKDLLD